MVLEIKAYECPICETLFRTEEESAQCFESCLSHEDPRPAFMCSKCEDVFRDKGDAERHEQECDCVSSLRDVSFATCLTCRHSDPEGHRWSPCPELHFAPVREACEVYEYAER